MPLVLILGALAVLCGGFAMAKLAKDLPANRDMAKLRPDFRAKVERFLLAAKARGIEVYVIETVRSIERQAALFAQGRTAPGPIVTWTMESRHLPDKDGLSKAVDVWVKPHGFDAEGVKAVGAKLASVDDLAKAAGLARPALAKGDLGHYEAA